MSIQSQIDRLTANVAAALEAVAAKGVTVPDNANSDNLAALIAAIPTTEGNMANYTATLTASGWVENEQTISVSNATADCTLFVGADVGSEQEYATCEVWCSGQGDGTLTFSCTYVPDEDLAINIAIFS